MTLVKHSELNKNSFALDVEEGLSSNPKFLSSKYFYDDEGFRLFQHIMKLPEYYVTGAEYEIFSSQTINICKAFGYENSFFDLIELGAGDGTKTACLIDFLLKNNADFNYVPIDISRQSIESLTKKFKILFPGLSINSQIGDYFEILQNLQSDSERKKIILFLGASVGNFLLEEIDFFFKNLRNYVNTNDYLLIGFDLQKDPKLILRAYDDEEGVTAKFNLNLLKRINRELGGTFVLEDFSHYAVYLPVEGEAKSYIISRANQTVYINRLSRSFAFRQWEPIFMEISRKYNPETIQHLSNKYSFRIEQNFFDSQNFFTDSLWKPI